MPEHDPQKIVVVRFAEGDERFAYREDVMDALDLVGELSSAEQREWSESEFIDFRDKMGENGIAPLGRPADDATEYDVVELWESENRVVLHEGNGVSQERKPSGGLER